MEDKMFCSIRSVSLFLLSVIKSISFHEMHPRLYLNGFADEVLHSLF